MNFTDHHQFLLEISDLKNMEEKIGIIRKFSSLIRDSTEVTLNGIKFFCDFEYSETSMLMNLSAESFCSPSFEKSIFICFNTKFKQANIDFYNNASNFYATEFHKYKQLD